MDNFTTTEITYVERMLADELRKEVNSVIQATDAQLTKIRMLGRMLDKISAHFETGTLNLNDDDFILNPLGETSDVG